MGGFIGRPYDDTRGTIREAMINYHPAFHETIDSAIGRLEDIYFILFNGPDKEEMSRLVEEKCMKMANRVIPNPYAVDFMESNQRSIFGVLDYCEPLMKRKYTLRVHSQHDTQEYMHLKEFLEFASLVAQSTSLRHKRLNGLSAQQIKNKYKNRIELVNVGYPIAQFARDVIISLYDEDKNVLVASKQGESSGIVGQYDMNFGAQASDPVWDARGYETREGPNLLGLVGGQIVANEDYMFVGVNAFEQSIISDGKEKAMKELEHIGGDARIMYQWDPELKITDHVDVLMMPVNDDTIMVSDPTATEKVLKKSRIKTVFEMGKMGDYVRFSGTLKNRLKEAGLNVVPSPFWVGYNDNGHPSMFSYCNSLQDTDTVYAPKRGESGETRKLVDTGKVLDDWFYEEVSKYKTVIPVSGFSISHAWKDAGLRCLVNVTRRDVDISKKKQNE